jgi:hypothetical protein
VSEDLTFVPIEPKDFYEKMRMVTGRNYNMQALSPSEILRSGDAFRCPACGCRRYLMWRAVYPFLALDKYCTCPEVKR